MELLLELVHEKLEDQTDNARGLPLHHNATRTATKKFSVNGG